MAIHAHSQHSVPTGRMIVEDEHALSEPPSVRNVIALLDLPAGTALGVDGQSLVLKRSDFVGLNRVPSGIHLITCRNTKESVGVGFIMLLQGMFVRRYDCKTGEPSPTPVDSVTADNLWQLIQDGAVEPQRVVEYQRVVNEKQQGEWRNQTEFISSSLFKTRSIDPLGEKIVPGAYGDNDDNSTKEVDGKSISYPPIAVIDPALGTRAATRHEGTKQYLAKLSVSDRTSLFVCNDAANIIFDRVLRDYAHWKDLLGNLQLSFLLFLHLHCLSSLQHWRDLLAMLSLVQKDRIALHSALFSGLFQVLTYQLAYMEADFFEDLEYSGDNFFIPVIQRLCSACAEVEDDNLNSNRQTFVSCISNKFPTFFSDGSATEQDAEECTGTTGQESNETIEVSNAVQLSTRPSDHDDMMDDSDDEDEPVVVPNDEVEASLSRSKVQAHHKPDHASKQDQLYKEEYPLLFASKTEHEDVVMACARILDEANDVSLVREAAAYLQEVEAKRHS